jgi:hypothetical protein
MQQSNARINRARIQRIKQPTLRMKAALFALRLNELLGGVVSSKCGARQQHRTTYIINAVQHL